ncbi:MAG: 30S ribosomal protein S12 methylthiotransferase RimO [Planctomycetia bacterium]|nr:30S ribosomal protein S12 methylthiotransferase RimO [Planctomycetia bacterium]
MNSRTNDTSGREKRSRDRRSSQKSPIRPSAKTFSIVSLGCPKNLVDGESMVGLLTARDYRFVSEARNVELVILNTCGFIEAARNEAFECLNELLELKKRGRICFLVVTGCLIQVEKREELLDRFRDVDAWLGPFTETELVDVVERLRSGNIEAEVPKVAVSEETVDPTTQTTAIANTNEKAASETPSLEPSWVKANRVLPTFRSTPQKHLTFFDHDRELLTLGHVAYLKIAEGCDRFCSYCLIPSIRGRFVSKPMNSILDEAKRLAEKGVRELVLIAQETTFWGSDLDGSPRLASLLIQLRDLGLFDWIRVLYSYPQGFDDELLSVLGSTCSKADSTGQSLVLPYVDLPLQHCNDTILKQMNRRCGKCETEELLSRLRETIPNLILRTSIIVGFPGETDAIFAELVDFMAKWKFERAGIFEFSPEAGTPASTLPDQVPARVRNQRYKKLYAKQERISHGFSRGLVGRSVPVLVDRMGSDGEGNEIDDLFLGRTLADAPDVDPLVYITGTNLIPGTFVDCEMVDVSGLDLIAIPAEQD